MNDDLRQELDNLLIEFEAWKLYQERAWTRRYEEHLIIMEWLK